MSTVPTPSPITEPPAPVGLTVHLLRRWDRHVDDTCPFYSYAAALAALAGAVRADWPDITHRADVPDSCESLSDAEVVRTFYGDDGTGEFDAPTSGTSDDAGFAIVKEHVAGPEPGEVSLRLGTLRVLDADPAEDTAPAVTYCLDADGLTVAVFPGPDGHPTVLITPEGQMSGVPVTVRLEDPFGPGGFEQTYRVS
ncbi:hypothetical protein [Umezawaea sp. Da 62-37]|uniref:hypothetical protein n=1 Tax=Umezawaea sp. Da 62-37 TaxID=3075927 RepID=UPI0028F728EE|nr:hypothetical protein [Umezawaea sp. Da 62-37]WNV83130.1 hypothetical protein RM788_33755 [Umezawaea sp. Da 62-37]